MFYEEAETINEDLECFLSALLELNDPEDPGKAKKTKDEKGQDAMVTRRDMKRMRGLISASDAIELNQAQEFFATVKASIEDGQSPAVLVAYLRQVRSDNGFSTLDPVICIGRTLPIGSAIFDIVSGGDVVGLQRLLARGEGSLRDRDSRGTPPLHNPRKIDGGSRTPIWLTRETAIELDAISDYFRLLLEAGADPCSALYDDVDDPNFRFVLFFDHNAMKLILNNPIPFVDIDSRDSQGSTMLLCFAAKCSGFDDPISILNLFLAKGDDISARDRRGRNCLRLTLESLWDEEATDQVRECIALLIRNGADIHSVDQDGVSVFDYAYENPIEIGTGSCRGDAWDAALSECGYDVRQMRHGYHRLPVCADGDFGSSEYQQKSFKQLWKGREDACPSYHHPPLWYPRSALPAGLCPLGGDDWLCPGPEAASSHHPGSPIGRTQEMNEPETDDLYGGDDLVRVGGEDSNCTEDAGFYDVDHLKDSDLGLGREEMEANRSSRRAEPVSVTTQISEIAQEDPAAESASDSSSEYYDLPDNG